MMVIFKPLINMMIAPGVIPGFFFFSFFGHIPRLSFSSMFHPGTRLGFFLFKSAFSDLLLFINTRF